MNTHSTEVEMSAAAELSILSSLDRIRAELGNIQRQAFTLEPDRAHYLEGVCDSVRALLKLARGTVD